MEESDLRNPWSVLRGFELVVVGFSHPHGGNNLKESDPHLELLTLFSRCREVPLCIFEMIMHARNLEALLYLLIYIDMSNL